MGIAKKVLFGAGAIVLAPVVVPTAVAVGTAAAAGVAATAGAAATFVAGTTAGTAAVGAMAAVGSTVGTVAGAVGLSSVATIAGTSAGAAAVGTIATSGAVGVVSAGMGSAKMIEASEIKKEAQSTYKTASDSFKAQESKTESSLERLGRMKQESWEILHSFVDTYGKIKHVDFDDNLPEDVGVSFDIDEFNEVKYLALTVKDAMKGGSLALTGGQLIGLATSTGFTSITKASTGTAIASLHGAAATRASMAALGGGSIASGGLGMAGGTAVVNALTFAPAMAISGIFINRKGKHNLEAANGAMTDANNIKKELEEDEKELAKLEVLSNRMYYAVVKFAGLMKEYNTWLNNKLSETDDFRLFDKLEQKKTKIARNLSIILKRLVWTKLLDDENNLRTSEVNKVIDDNQKLYDSLIAA